MLQAFTRYCWFHPFLESQFLGKINYRDMIREDQCQISINQSPVYYALAIRSRYPELLFNDASYLANLLCSPHDHRNRPPHHTLQEETPEEARSFTRINDLKTSSSITELAREIDEKLERIRDVELDEAQS